VVFFYLHKLPPLKSLKNGLYVDVAKNRRFLPDQVVRGRVAERIVL
jgi:hypothetical protein